MTYVISGYLVLVFRDSHGTEQKAGQRLFTHFSDKDAHQVEGVCTGSGGNSGFFITLLSIWGSHFESVDRRLFIHNYATGILEKPENRMEIHETDGCGGSGIRGNWDGRGRYLSPVRNVLSFLLASKVVRGLHVVEGLYCKKKKKNIYVIWVNNVVHNCKTWVYIKVWDMKYST